MPNTVFIPTFLLFMIVFFFREMTDYDWLFIIKIKTRSHVKVVEDEVDEIDLEFNKKIWCWKW
jgi:hypothetical protein